MRSLSPASSKRCRASACCAVGDGGGGDPAPVAAGGVQREPAPAGADLEHVVAGAEVELAADPVVLRDGCLGQRRLLVFEDAAGVGQGFVQKELVELVSQVVVREDVAAASPARVLVERVRELQDRGGEAREPLVHAPEELRLPGEYAQQRREVVRRPEPGHEGLGRPDRAAEKAIPVEPLVVDGQGRLERGPAGVKAERAALGTVDKREPSMLELFEKGEQNAARKAVERPGAGCCEGLDIRGDNGFRHGEDLPDPGRWVSGWGQNGAPFSVSLSACQ